MTDDLHLLVDSLSRRLADLETSRTHELAAVVAEQAEQIKALRREAAAHLLVIKGMADLLHRRLEDDRIVPTGDPNAPAFLRPVDHADEFTFVDRAGEILWGPLKG